MTQTGFSRSEIFLKASIEPADCPFRICEARKVLHRRRSSRFAKRLKILRRVRTNDWTSCGNEALVSVVELTGSERWLASLHPAGFVPMAGFGQWQRIAVVTVGGER
jgi:hypothetical protein